MTTAYAVTSRAVVGNQLQVAEPTAWRSVDHDDLGAIKKDLEHRYGARLHHRGNGLAEPRDPSGDPVIIIRTDHHDRPRYLYASEVFCGRVKWTTVSADRMVWGIAEGA